MAVSRVSLKAAASSQCGICAAAVMQASLTPGPFHDRRISNRRGANGGRSATEIQAVVWPGEWPVMAVIVDALLCDQDERGTHSCSLPGLQDENVQSLEADLPKGLPLASVG